MTWWRPKIRRATVDPERAQGLCDEAAERLAEAKARSSEVAELSASLKRQSRNAFAAEVEAALRRKRTT